MVEIGSLKPAEGNPRLHPRQQINAIAGSMLHFGVTRPVLVDAQGQIVAGQAIYEAGKQLGLKHLPVVELAHLSEAEVAAYRLADNKLAEKSRWDRQLLAVQLDHLKIELPKLDLSIVTGFSPGEIDSLAIDFADSESLPTEDVPSASETVLSKTGDIFVLGRHRLAVGDARDADIYARLMQSTRADMAFLDPPYNVPNNGHVGGRGKTKHREFKHAHGEMDSPQFTEFLHGGLTLCAANLVDGAIAFCCMDWRHLSEIMAAGGAAFTELKNLCVWDKGTPGQGTFYRSQHELILVYKNGTAPHINTFELGQHGRSRSNVWKYPGANVFRSGRMDDLRMHPTVKPIAMIVDAMRDCSRRGSIVLDAYAGSGSLIMAAEQIGRRAFCIEIDPQYADVAIRRWQNATGKDATLEHTGQTYNELSDR